MKVQIFSWNEVSQDSPVPLLKRRLLTGEKGMVAQVELAPGCVVASHHHESEQVAVILSGRVRWNLGTPGTPDFLEHEAGGGEVLVLPPNFPHGLVALEETVIIDFLSPPGKMGVDNQG